MLKSKNIARAFPALTARETAVVACIAHGMTNAEAAAELGITERTVKNVACALPLKMGLRGGGSARVRVALAAHGLPFHGQ